MVALIVMLTTVVFIGVDALLRLVMKSTGAGQPLVRRGERRLQMPMPVDHVPRGVFLNPGHTWVQLESGGTLRFGADRLALFALGELERVTVCPVGTKVGKGDPLAILARGARSLTLRAPVDGVIEAVNTEVQADPSQLHRNPFGRSWLCRLSPEQLAPALREMFVGEEVGAWMQSELRRLGDFIASLAGSRRLAEATLQDGGMPIEGFAGLLDEESWERFVAAFFTPEV